MRSGVGKCFVKVYTEVVFSKFEGVERGGGSREVARIRLSLGRVAVDLI